MTRPVDQATVHRNAVIDHHEIQSRMNNRASKQAREIVVYPPSQSDSNKTYSVLAGDACFMRAGMRQNADSILVISNFNGVCVPPNLVERQFGRDQFSKARRALYKKFVFAGVAATNIFHNAGGSGGANADPTNPVIKTSGVIQVINTSGQTMPACAMVRVRFPLTPIVRNPKAQAMERDWVKAQYVPFDLSDVFPSAVSLRENLQLKSRSPEQHPGDGDDTKDDAPYHVSIQKFIQAVGLLAIMSFTSMGGLVTPEQFVGLDTNTVPVVLTEEQARGAFNSTEYAGMSTSKAFVHAAMGLERTKVFANLSKAAKEALINAFAEMFAHNESAIREAMLTVVGKSMSTADHGSKFDVHLTAPNI